MPRLMFAHDNDTGQWWSRVENHPAAVHDKIAVPVLDYEAIGADGDYTRPFAYRLEAMTTEALQHANLVWTRNVPLHIRNLHREFWGLQSLRPSRESLTFRQAAALQALESSDAPLTEPEVAERMGRKPGRALPFLLQVAAKGLVRVDNRAGCVLWAVA